MKIEALSSELLHQMDAYWRAADYSSVGQIYPFDNSLLKRPLTLAHIKPGLLGYWGSTPGLNFIDVHLNRVIKEHELNAIYITGPGHGGPGLEANTYREGTYSEGDSNITQDADGMQRLFKQFSPSPAGFPVTSHRKRPVRFTRAANWVMRCRTLSGRRLTIPTCWSRALSATTPNGSRRMAGTRNRWKTATIWKLSTVPSALLVRKPNVLR